MSNCVSCNLVLAGLHIAYEDRHYCLPCQIKLMASALIIARETMKMGEGLSLLVGTYNLTVGEIIERSLPPGME